MNITSVVEKVQKLLALTNSANAGEAANAAAAANKLIDQYRLSTADLEVEGQVEDPLEEDGGFIYESGKITPWKHQLMHRLMDHYGLSCWNDTTYPTGRMISRFRLVGRKNDIAVAKYMFAWLTLECQRLSNVEAKGYGRVYVASYCEGFVNGVDSQLKKSRAEVSKGASHTSIVKIDARAGEAKSFMNVLHSNLVYKKASSSRRINGAAYDQGKTRGSNVHLGQSLTGGAPKLLGQ